MIFPSNLLTDAKHATSADFNKTDIIRTDNDTKKLNNRTRRLLIQGGKLNPVQDYTAQTVHAWLSLL